jgi:hypothetical protein
MNGRWRGPGGSLALPHRYVTTYKPARITKTIRVIGDTIRTAAAACGIDELRKERWTVPLMDFTTRQL